GFLVLAARDADERAVIGLGIERRNLVEQPARLVRAQRLVVDPAQRREVLTAMPPAGRRHHRLLVPHEDARHALDVDDAREPLLQLRERIGHGPEPSYASSRARRSSTAASRRDTRSSKSGSEAGV